MQLKPEILAELESMIRGATREAEAIADQVSWEDADYMRGYRDGLTAAWRLLHQE